MSPIKPELLFCLGLLLLVSTGCQSAKEPGGASHASVRIQGRSLIEIQQATVEVFGEENYKLTTDTPALMVFERPGNGWDIAKWGGLAGGVTMRVKIRFSSSLTKGYLLQADAYAVQDSDDEFFRTESRNMLLSRHPYQKLLDKVAERLKWSQ